jgi:hypothetical protein
VILGPGFWAKKLQFAKLAVALNVAKTHFAFDF